MCDELTSSIMSVKEPYEVQCWNISNHTETWRKLGIKDGPHCPYRESEWPAGNAEPTIRFREEDDADTRQRLIDSMLRRWPTCSTFAAYCMSKATKVYANSVKELPALPASLKTLYAGSVSNRTSRLKEIGR
jgi:hypothetical protein